jgi:uncharacterized protein (TIGR02678 family)
MPAEGTEAHVTLLVADYLSRTLQGGTEHADRATTESDIVGFIEEARLRYGRYWRRSAREPGTQRELAQLALERLRKLRLIAMSPDGVRPLPAISRFAAGPAEVRETGATRKAPPRQNSDAR